MKKYKTLKKSEKSKRTLKPFAFFFAASTLLLSLGGRVVGAPYALRGENQGFAAERAAAPFEDSELAAAHSETTPYNWYCKHMKNGAVPPLDPQMKFIENYGGYYLDKNASDDKKVIYLTFDAGYENGNVKTIVDVLKEKNVTGAFFVLENLVKTSPELIKEMAANGNLVCNHTASHKDMTKVKDESEFVSELKKLETVLKDTAGVECAPYYRPPEGRFNEQNLKWASSLGYKTVMWSFAYVDWDNNNQMSPESAIKKVLDGTHNGEVILLHPTSSTNAEIIGALIDEWRKAGYSFGTLDELCGAAG